MEDVLEVYHRQFEDNEALVCLDETSKQLVRETRTPLPPRPGSASPATITNTSATAWATFSCCLRPWRDGGGWRPRSAAPRPIGRRWCASWWMRTTRDRDRIVLVMDNLNTHHPSSLYEAFEPPEARRIAERLEIHYTPKHGSWLNMAEIELGVLDRQCLDRRIGTSEILEQETQAWQDQRNRDAIRVDWRFTTQDARIKLKSLYPSIQR